MDWKFGTGKDKTKYWVCWPLSVGHVGSGSHNLNWAGMEEKGGRAQPKPDLESDPISILNFYLFYQINFYLKLIFYKIFKSFFLLVVRKFMIILFYFNFLNKNDKFFKIKCSYFCNF